MTCESAGGLAKVPDDLLKVPEGNSGDEAPVDNLCFSGMLFFSRLSVEAYVSRLVRGEILSK